MTRFDIMTLVCCVIAVVSALFWVPEKTKLGVDLRGGAELIYRFDFTESTAKTVGRADDLRFVQEVVSRRLDRFGINELSIEPIGSQRLGIQIPGDSKDIDRVIGLVERVGELSLHLVAEPEWQTSQRQGTIVEAGRDGLRVVGVGNAQRTVEVGAGRSISGSHIDSARETVDDYNRPAVAFGWDSIGASSFAELTANNIGRSLAIVLDDEIVTEARIQKRISEQVLLEGEFTGDEVREITAVLLGGSLPAKPVLESRHEVQAKLGTESIKSGLTAIALAFVATLSIALVWYRRWGWVAASGVAVTLASLALLLVGFRVTLTLAGLAGVLLTVGMAVDAFVLIFERIREERDKGVRLSRAVHDGFIAARRAILDANITTAIAAWVLFSLGSGSVRSFSMVLMMGIAVTVLVSLVVGPVLVRALSRWGWLRDAPRGPSFPRVDVYAARRWVSLSLLTLLGTGLFAAHAQGRSMLGIDFAGGVRASVDLEQPVDVDTVRAAFAEDDALRGVELQALGGAGASQQFTLRAPVDGAGSSAVAHAVRTVVLKEGWAESRNSIVSSIDEIAPTVAQSLESQSAIALLVAFSVIAVYLALRFKARFGVAAVAAVVHDLLFSLGALAMADACSLFGRSWELDLPVVAGFLTVIGYSLNDTIVIFDRVREDSRQGHETKEVIAAAVRSCLGRTLVTSMTTLVAVALLLVGGGEALRSFAFVLVVGVTVGTLSSMYIACPILAWLSRRDAQRKANEPTELAVQECRF